MIDSFGVDDSERFPEHTVWKPQEAQETVTTISRMNRTCNVLIGLGLVDLGVEQFITHNQTFKGVGLVLAGAIFKSIGVGVRHQVENDQNLEPTEP